MKGGVVRRTLVSIEMQLLAKHSAQNCTSVCSNAPNECTSGGVCSNAALIKHPCHQDCMYSSYHAYVAHTMQRTPIHISRAHRKCAPTVPLSVRRCLPAAARAYSSTSYPVCRATRAHLPSGVTGTSSNRLATARPCTPVCTRMRG